MNETKLSIGIAFYALRQFYNKILIDIIINTGCPKHKIRLCLSMVPIYLLLNSELTQILHSTDLKKTAVETKSMQSPTKVFFSCIHYSKVAGLNSFFLLIIHNKLNLSTMFYFQNNNGTINACN